MPAQDIPAVRAGPHSAFRMHASILSRPRADAWVHRYRGAGPALPAHTRGLEVWYGQPVIHISLRFDRRAMDAR